MKRALPAAAAQRGVALISAMLLLMIITILALSMFRSFPTQEKIAGNVREKERAFHAANSTLQFAEWWLQANVGTTGDIVCTPLATPPNANLPGEGQICSNPLYTFPPQPAGLVASVNSVPWGGGTIGVLYTPNGMTVGTGNPLVTANDSAYAGTPMFYIADLGAAGDAQGEAYQIDAYAYGGSTNTVAVVESIYEIAQGVVNRSGE